MNSTSAFPKTLSSLTFSLFLFYNASGTGFFCTQTNEFHLHDRCAVTGSGITIGSDMHVLQAREAPDGKFYACADLIMVGQVEIQHTKSEATKTITNNAQKNTASGTSRKTDNLQTVFVGTASLHNRPYILKNRLLSLPAVCVLAASGSPFGLCCCPFPYFGNGCWASNRHNTCGSSF